MRKWNLLPAMVNVIKGPEQGAATTVLAALGISMRVREGRTWRVLGSGD
jgi:hypothetical protein